MSTITIKDIAKICGVGVTTVSRAINNHPDINPETKQKVMDTIAAYHYIPNNSARNLKRVESRTVALLIKGIENPFFHSMLSVFEQEIEAKGFDVLIHAIDEKEDELAAAMELEKEKRLRGIIFLGGSFKYTEEQLSQFDVPYVLCTIAVANRHLDKNVYSSVCVDDIYESYKAVDYLCRMGHRKIAIITADTCEGSIAQMRLGGYRKALKEHQIPLDEDLVVYMSQDIPEYTPENGYVSAKKLLESGKEFTALYVISDYTALGACKAILESGRRIPEDISVVGFDGIPIVNYYNPPLTTMKQPCDQMAREAVKMLFEHIDGNYDSRHEVFRAELLEGGTVKRLCVEA